MSAACGGRAGTAGVASVVAGAMDAAAEAMAARRANSRREIRLGFAVLGLGVSSIKISVCALRRSKKLFAAGSEEATESRSERQHRRKRSAGKEVRREILVATLQSGCL